MDKEENLKDMQSLALMRYRNENSSKEVAIAAIQAYATCSVALSLDMIAHALSQGIDPEITTTLKRIANGVEMLEHS